MTAGNAELPENDYWVPALQRGLRILEMFDGVQRTLGSNEIAARLGVSVSAIYRILFTLSEMGYLRKIDRNTYELGTQLISNGFSYLASRDIVDVAMPLLNTLRDKTSLSCHLAIREQTESLYLYRAFAAQRLSVNIPIGTRIPCHCTAMGRILLSELPADTLDQLYQRVRLDDYPPPAPKSLPELAQLLGEDRERGWVLHRSDYSTAIASAVRDHTVEDSFSMIHASRGQLEPLSTQMRSEPAIVAGIAAATLGKRPVDWLWLVEDYARIRELIAATIPGFAGFDHRLHRPGGFYLGNAAARREWNTASGRAEFKAHALPADLLPEQARWPGMKADFILQTLRSHDQYNTTLYGLDDRYRGVKGMRKVVFVNPADIQRLGLEAGQQVDLVSLWDDGIERRVSGFTLLAYDTPPGQAAAYYPETNPLVPLESFGARSYTPTSKSVGIKLEPSVGRNNQIALGGVLIQESHMTADTRDNIDW